jgi:hypothetical protein
MRKIKAWYIQFMEKLNEQNTCPYKKIINRTSNLDFLVANVIMGQDRIFTGEMVLRDTVDIQPERGENLFKLVELKDIIDQRLRVMNQNGLVRRGILGWRLT